MVCGARPVREAKGSVPQHGEGTKLKVQHPTHMLMHPLAAGMQGTRCTAGGEGSPPPTPPPAPGDLAMPTKV